MNLSEHKKTIEVGCLILGGGISGIFTGNELMQRGIHDFLILEKDTCLGGLCRSFKIGDLYYDVGAHALHKNAVESSEELRRVIDVNKLYCQKRNARVFIYNKLIPHPFQLHLYYAPFRIRLRCLIGYLSKEKRKSNNLSDWLRSEFGDYVCECFLFPYNQKVWKMDLKNISVNWVSRVSSGSMKFFKGLFFGGNQNYSSNEYVCYPQNGGFESLFSGMIHQLRGKFETGCEVVKINLDEKVVTTKEGGVYHYESLVSTLPIDLFFRKLTVAEENEMLGLVARLEKVSACLVTFLAKKNRTKMQRVYISDKKYLAQRVIINSNSSAEFKLQNQSVFSLEISYKLKEELPSERHIIDNCKILLKDLKLIETDDDIRDCKVDYVEYMYPTQTLDSVNVVAKIKSYLENYDCFTIGRFGSWNYANVDGILDEVISLVKTNF